MKHKLPLEGGPIEQVIMQSTPLCNLNCTYCYLPAWSRSMNKHMSMETVISTFSVLSASNNLADEIDVRWHAGEPLLTPLRFYKQAFSEIRNIVARDKRISHSLQTNATLINEDWCRFFLENEIRVGISIDGPARIHDAKRVSKGGKGTFEKVMQGVKMLQEFGVPFEIIAVITLKSLSYPDELFSFFEKLNPTAVALNIEESECEHESDLINNGGFIQNYKRFFSRIYSLQKNSALRFREIEEIKNVLLYGKEDQYNLQVHPFAIATIDWEGNIYTFSPELAGMNHGKYASFSCGNVRSMSFGQIMASERFRTLSEEVKSGVEMCRKECEFFMVCGGGAPANKLYENGSFQSTETAYCKARYQIPTDIILSDLENVDAGMDFQLLS